MMMYVSLVKRACCLWFYRHIPIYTYTRTHLYVYIYGPHGAASTQNQSLTAVASHALTYTPIRTHVYMYKYGPASNQSLTAVASHIRACTFIHIQVNIWSCIKSVIDCRCKRSTRSPARAKEDMASMWQEPGHHSTRCRHPRLPLLPPPPVGSPPETTALETACCLSAKNSHTI